MNGILWSEQLDRIFMTNYESDPSLTWQYFGSSTGFMRQYPGMSDIPAARQYLCIVRMPMMFVVKPQMCLINLLGFYLLDKKKKIATKWGQGEWEPDLFDCRLRPWYLQAAASPKDMIILVDTSGSMTGVRKEIAKHVVLTLLDTLSENDFINIYKFSEKPIPVVPCFHDKLVQVRSSLAAFYSRLCCIRSYSFCRVLAPYMLITIIHRPIWRMFESCATE